MSEQQNKPHRKGKERKDKSIHSGGMFTYSCTAILHTTPVLTFATEKNPKAFAFSNPGKLQRAAARSGDVRLPPATTACVCRRNALLTLLLSAC